MSNFRPLFMNGHPKSCWRIAVLIQIGLVLSLLTSGCRSVGDVEKKTKATPPSLEEKWGIQISSVRLSAAGHMIDFRYRVIDPAKAAPLGDRKLRPYLIDDGSGSKLGVPNAPKVGALRQNAQKIIAGRIYFILFSNAGQVVKAGSKVTVVIGDCRVKNLTVE